MPSIYDLERKFGWIAIPHLIRGIAIMQAICWALGYMNPDFWGALAFSRGAIFEGQVWRLISWVFVPLTSSPIFIIFATMILWMFGDIIESAWGIPDHPLRPRRSRHPDRRRAAFPLGLPEFRSF
ncbi:MAG: hypothetical protein R3F11_16935 [Verrucomicrobiales bacterium]